MIKVLKLTEKKGRLCIYTYIYILYIYKIYTILYQPWALSPTYFLVSVPEEQEKKNNMAQNTASSLISRLQWAFCLLFFH